MASSPACRRSTRSARRPTSRTARSLRGAREVNLTGQGVYDPILGTTHLGILNSPDTRTATFEFLTEHMHPRSH